jgi:hypothetical protein
VGKDAEWGSLLEKPPLRHADDTDSATLSHAVDIFVERHHLLWKVCSDFFCLDLVLIGLLYKAAPLVASIDCKSCSGKNVKTSLVERHHLLWKVCSDPTSTFLSPTNVNKSSLKNTHVAPFVMALP